MPIDVLDNLSHQFKSKHMNTLQINNLSKTYPNGVKAINGISIKITNGMFGY